MIKQKVAFHKFINLLLYFIAVLGIDRLETRKGYRWKGANDFTGQLAGIIWYMRIIMLEHFFEDLPEDPGKLIIEMLEAVLDKYWQ